MTISLFSTKRRLAVALAGLLALVCVGPGAFAQAKKKATAPAPAKAGRAEAAEAASAEAGKAGAAATPAANGNDAANDQTKVKIERGAGGRKIYKIEGEIVIEGKIQKPEAFYVLQKSGINYDWHELKQDFVPKILDSVTKAPF